MAYLTVSELRGYLRNERGVVDDTYLTIAIEAATISAERFCGRKFTAYGGGGATALSHVPSGTNLLVLKKDATTISSITENGTTLASTYWQAEPVDNLDDSGNTVPYEVIRRIDGGTWSQTSGYPGKASISVTATWGWVSVPYEVKQATLIMAKQIVEERDVRSGLVDFGEFAAQTTRSKEVVNLLTPLRSGFRTWGMA